jgi:short-subunit dehydrogenase
MSRPQTILITGATSGIGRHAAIHLAGRGHRVIATGRSLAALQGLAREVAAIGFEIVQLDVTDAESIASARQKVLEVTAGAGVDALVNNAGYATAGALAELGDHELRAQFDTNVFGLMAVTRAFLPEMFTRGSGRIVNISSVSGRIPAPMLGAYHASKYALEALSDALRMELRPFGLRVVVVEPGTIRTNFAERTVDEGLRARTADTKYASIYARTEALRDKFAARAAGPEAVSRAIERAITSRAPAARYVAPAYFGLAILLVRLLPTRWMDSLMCHVAGLTRRGLGLEAGATDLMNASGNARSEARS